MDVDNIKTKDILAIKPGTAKMFRLKDSRACHSARALVGYVKRCRKPANVYDYTTEVDWSQNIIRIFAHGEGKIV